MSARARLYQYDRMLSIRSIWLLVAPTMNHRKVHIVYLGPSPSLLCTLGHVLMYLPDTIPKLEWDYNTVCLGIPKA